MRRLVAAWPALILLALGVSGCRTRPLHGEPEAAASLDLAPAQASVDLHAPGDAAVAGDLASPVGPDLTSLSVSDLGAAPADLAIPVDLAVAYDLTPPPGCGNGMLEPGEECDNGNDNGAPELILYQQSVGTVAIVPVESPAPGAGFYGYQSASSHMGYEQPLQSRMLLHRDTKLGGWSLILNHGSEPTASGQTQPSARVRLTVDASFSGMTLDLCDDQSQDQCTFSSATQFRGDWRFKDNTDGAVLGNLPLPGANSLTITPDFRFGISEWVFLDGSGKQIVLDRQQPVTIKAVDRGALCRSNCTVPRCGDGIVDVTEACDSTLGCLPTCAGFSP